MFSGVHSSYDPLLEAPISRNTVPIKYTMYFDKDSAVSGEEPET